LKNKCFLFLWRYFLLFFVQPHNKWVNKQH
jgi:hypothetical protein